MSVEIAKGSKAVLVYHLFHNYQGDLLDAGKFYVKSVEHAHELLSSFLDDACWGFDYISYYVVVNEDWNDYDTYVSEGF